MLIVGVIGASGAFPAAAGFTLMGLGALSMFGHFAIFCIVMRKRRKAYERRHDEFVVPLQNKINKLRRTSFSS